MIDRRCFIATGTAAAAAACFAPIGRAQAQLAGNAFIISGFPAGGIGDLVSRPMAEKMRGRYATNVLADNRVGAGGRIAVEYVKRAAPDGLTILQIPASIMTLYPHIYRNLAYDPLTDFAPVSTTATYVYSFTASAALPAEIKTVADFVTWARANPKLSSYGIPAAGSALHFAGMMLQRAANFEFSAIPYRGGAPLLADMLAGVIPVSFNVLGEVLPHIRSGKLRSLAVCSPERSPFAPEIPTMVEQGFREIALQEWLGWFLPAKTPQAIVQSLNEQLREGLHAPEMVETLGKSALQPRYMTPDAFAAQLKTDYERWAPIVKATGFTAME
ncbi:tripartite tricarboxylate transporter substrate-binding protein [Pseudorhodoplanes sp.]|uniref:tripartite tricarboxylate transporter substrate-binding protein n=1 Tax=Pseudorhodoplanes sp. TaxID=1934341 RepID=UPI003919068A